MHLTDRQLQTFDEDGYLFFAGTFSPDEAALLKAEADAVYALERWRDVAVDETLPAVKTRREMEAAFQPARAAE